MCVGEWKRHAQSDLFREYSMSDWKECLQHSEEWISSNWKIPSKPKRVVTGKRKRAHTPDSPQVHPPTAASASAAITPPSDLSASDSDSNDTLPDRLPELGDMLRDCQRMQRALTRLINNIQKYIDATSD